MKKIVVVIVMLMSFFSVSVYALKVGTVNMEAVLKDSSKTADIKADLMKRFSGRNKHLAAQAKTLQDDLKTYEKNKAVMSPDKLDQLKKKIQTEEASLQQSKQKFQSDVASEQMVLSRKLIESIKTSISGIAKSDHLDLVMPNTVVLYSQNSVDITPQLLKAMK